MKTQWYEIDFRVWKRNPRIDYLITIVIWLEPGDIVQDIVDEINKQQPEGGITLGLIKILKTNGTKEAIESNLIEKIQKRLSTSRNK